ncbi:MAG TPA: ATP-binding protein [Spirochaetota bacterium]|nr:ATP-binding protein [Spirochaetota bacterium]
MTTLRMKILVPVIGILVVGYTLGFYLIFSRYHDQARDRVYGMLRESARHYALQIGSRLLNGLNIAVANASFYRGILGVRGGFSRESLVAILRENLRSKKLYGAWVVLDRNVLDGNDDAWVRHPLFSRSGGQFTPFWTLKNGETHYTAIAGFDNEKDPINEFYWLSKRSGFPAITEPYLDPDDQGTRMISLTAPIESPAGDVVGVAGADVVLEELSKMVQDFLKLEGGRVALVSERGLWAAHPEKQMLARHVGTNHEEVQLLRCIAERRESIRHIHSALLQGDAVRVVCPVLVGAAKQSWGLIIDVPEEEFFKDMRRAMLLTLVVTLVVLMVLVAAIIFLVGRMTRPMQRVAAAMWAFGGGDLGQRVPVLSQDEVGAISQRFNEMAETLEIYNTRLEDEIRKRSDQLVQSEKLAALGQLVAGIAHELNTPLGAIVSSSRTLKTLLYGSVRSIVVSLADMPENIREQCLKLARECVSVPVSYRSGEERKLRKALDGRLRDAGVNESSVVAERLVELGVVDIDEPLVQAILSPYGEAVIDIAVRMAQSVRLTEIVVMAAEKAAHVVSALKHYSRQNPDEEAGPVNVEEEIQAILTLYTNRIKYGVDVRLEFGVPAIVRGNRDRLNQVWINLVNNALQAMEYQGSLVIGGRMEDGGLMVFIRDSGPGIPPDVRSRIYEPFFTTKAMGEGTGLGLDIAKRIVLEHGGRIDFVTGESGTEFFVWLPLGGEE